MFHAFRPLAGGLLSLALALPLHDARAQAQRDTSLAQRLLEAEDARAPDASSLRLLLEVALRGAGAERLQAIRAVGRLERPLLADSLMPLLRDTSVAVRLATAHAVGQLVFPTAVAALDSATAARVVGDVTARLGQFAAYAEPDAEVRGALATSIGRAAHPGAAARAAAQRQLLERLGTAPAERRGVLRGLDWLWRVRGPEPGAGDVAGAVATLGRLARGGEELADRRWAATVLVSARALDVATAEALAGTRDPALSRLALLGLAASRADSARLRRFATTLAADSSPLVRIEAVRLLARGASGEGCAPLVRAMADPHPHVALVAIDGLGAPCAAAARDELAAAVRALSPAADRVTMHRAAHALVALASVDSALARSLLPAVQAHPAWIVRVYAARAAGRLGAGPALLALAADPDDNVREAALTALIAIEHPRTDSVAIAALARRDYQLVLTAAEWLRARGQAGLAARPALDALVRITGDRKDTSRDPRLALVRLAGKGGDASLAPRLAPFARDFDPVIAGEAARTVSAWTGRPLSPEPRPLPAPAVSLAGARALAGQRLRLTMAPEAGGGVIEIALDPATAPVTVQRVARLARAGHYTGRTFHRVVPTFVIQGGSPGANEYVGDGPYLRDELGPAAHARGTLGISTRGRDTGDAQLFVNLVDNPRLDFGYTVFGRVVRGLDVVDQVLEGDRIARAELVRR